MKEHIRIFKILWASLVAIEKLVSDKEKVFLSSHKTWSIVWKLHNNYVEAPKTIKFRAGVSAPKF